jgi:hypothetical protein
MSKNETESKPTIPAPSVDGEGLGASTVRKFYCKIIVETPESRFEADHTNPHLIEGAWAAIDAARMLGLQWSSLQYAEKKRNLANAQMSGGKPSAPSSCSAD